VGESEDKLCQYDAAKFKESMGKITFLDCCFGGISVNIGEIHPAQQTDCFVQKKIQLTFFQIQESTYDCTDGSTRPRSIKDSENDILTEDMTENVDVMPEHAEEMMKLDPSTPAIGVENDAALVIVGNGAFAVSGDGKVSHLDQSIFGSFPVVHPVIAELTNYQSLTLFVRVCMCVYVLCSLSLSFCFNDVD
jgi:hypothetical protein